MSAAIENVSDFISLNDATLSADILANYSNCLGRPFDSEHGVVCGRDSLFHKAEKQNGTPGMKSSWEQEYFAAVYEPDPHRIAELAEIAETSIKNRMREIMAQGTPTTTQEMASLSNALHIVRDLLRR
jgi:hypothetical protein